MADERIEDNRGQQSVAYPTTPTSRRAGGYRSESAHQWRCECGDSNELQHGRSGERGAHAEPLHQQAAEQAAHGYRAEDEEAQDVAHPTEELARNEALAQ